jgi:hypothetical protein
LLFDQVVGHELDELAGFELDGAIARLAPQPRLIAKARGAVLILAHRFGPRVQKSWPREPSTISESPLPMRASAPATPTIAGVSSARATIVV